MKKRVRLKAGVLSLVLGICLIITLITSALILLGYYYRIRHLNIKIKRELAYNIASSESWVLSAPNSFEYHHPTFLDLFGNGTDTVRINKFFWGFWDIYHLTNQKSHFYNSQRIIVGFGSDTIGGAALYLADDRRPISIAGDTKLAGNVYLPPSGIKTTYINRKGYSGDSLVYGKIKTSTENLPTLNSNRLNNIMSWLDKSFKQATDSLGELSYSDYVSKDIQFRYPIYRSANVVNIFSDTLGYEIIASDTLIIISANVISDGTIFIAPRIIIQEGFNGNLQAFARDSLVVEDNVVLNYPSALFVGCQSEECYLSVGESSVAGQIVLYGPNQEVRNKMMKLSKGSIVNGLVYCDGLLNFEGKIIGHVSTRKFYLKLGSSIFENHLFDAQIRQELRKEFLQSDIWGCNTNAGVLVYLND